MNRPGNDDIANGEDMTTNAFDDLIRRAAPPVPDPGPSRRQVRTLLHDRMRRVERRAERRHRWGVALAAMLAFVVVFGAQQPKLGSDDLSFERTTSLKINEDLNYRWVESPVRGKVTAVPENFSDEKIRQVQEGAIIGGQPPEAIRAWSVNGTTPDWKILYSYVADGERIRRVRKAKTISVPVGKDQRELVPFMIAEGESFLERVENGSLPGRHFGRVQADGVVFDVYLYEQTYAEYGTIGYYFGLPLSEP